MTTQIHADLVIDHVSVITMDPKNPFAKGVAISNGKFIGLLYHENEPWPLTPHGQRINGKGMTLFPGLIDAHCHLKAQISQDKSIFCGNETVTRIEDIISILRTQANQQPVGTWIRANGYNPFYLKEQRHPTRWDLDKATGIHPIRLRHVSRHASVLNSSALKMAGITENSTDPPGVSIVRDSVTNKPTGVIYGGDAWLSKKIVPPLTKNDLHSGADRLQHKLLSVGITAVQDATPTNNQDDLDFWAQKIKENWKITTQLMANHHNHDHMSLQLENEYSLDVQDRLEMGAIKIVMEPTPELTPTPLELLQLVIEATKKDIEVAIHVITPEMVWAAVTAIRSAKEIYPNKNIRHRLEHLSLCPDAFLFDIQESGAMVVTNPSLVYDHGDRYLADVDPSEFNWLYRMNSLHKNGILLAAGSDCPVATYNPWVALQTACMRATSSNQIIGVNEKLPRWAALELFTSGAAQAGGWHNIRGMIRPGFQADFLLLNQNPLTCPNSILSTIQVNSTWVRGELVYSRSFLI